MRFHLFSYEKVIDRILKIAFAGGRDNEIMIMRCGSRTPGRVCRAENGVVALPKEIYSMV
jgi:hypothetical protein